MSPGSGKSTLLVRTIEALRGRCPVAVIEGDQQTANGAERIRASGVPCLQLRTGKGCHLDAHMVGAALHELDLPEQGLLFLENVGNLVCPAACGLGEAHEVAILSVTEGESNPLKYPDRFLAADVMLLNKRDLLPYPHWLMRAGSIPNSGYSGFRPRPAKDPMHGAPGWHIGPHRHGSRRRLRPNRVPGRPE